MSEEMIEDAVIGLRLCIDMHRAGEQLSGYRASHCEVPVSSLETLLSAYNPNERLREALERAIETLVASRHLIAKYVPDHHWLPEHDERIAALKSALSPLPQGRCP